MSEEREPTSEGESPQAEASKREEMGGRGLAILALVAAVLSAGVTFALIQILGDDDPEGLRPASVEDLREVSDRLERPVFWAGEQEGRKLELTVNDRGYVYVRYLPLDVELGDERAAYATVATYPVEDALDVARQGEEKGRVEFRVPGGVAVYYRARPNSVYVARKDEDALVEIYHPDAKRARELARSGRIEPVR